LILHLVSGGVASEKGEEAKRLIRISERIKRGLLNDLNVAIPENGNISRNLNRVIHR
jgi:hypothetical protein